LTGALRLVVTLPVVPDLGRDVQLLAGYAGLGDRLADALLVAVERGRVDAAIAGLDRLPDRLTDLVGRHLEHAEAELRDAGSVVQRHAGNGGHECSCSWSGTGPRGCGKAWVRGTCPGRRARHRRPRRPASRPGTCPGRAAGH